MEQSMVVSLEDTRVDLIDGNAIEAKASWWEKPLLLLVLGLAAALMLAWVAFLAWVASWLLFAIWP